MSGDVAVDHAVEALRARQIVRAEDVIDAIRESRPRVGNLGAPRRWDLAGSELDDTVTREVGAEEADLAAAVGFEGEPDVAVGAETEEIGAVVVAVLDAEAKPR